MIDARETCLKAKRIEEIEMKNPRRTASILSIICLLFHIAFRATIHILT